MKDEFLRLIKVRENETTYVYSLFSNFNLHTDESNQNG